MFSIYDMVRLKIALAAAFFAAVSVAITQLIELTFIESTVANAAIEGLFVGVVVYFALKILERSVDSQ
ncbi:hypothetical protein SAMN04488556_3757 [Halostagnicola kamekurae]|uniref:Uncharacterized protein n=1 Tax=Halostagnicola kamekurae TaxID=619731 RepID=A0A1I6UCT9_9EURY|nr:hypothetical protein SAMN04488556_3757 [Halostagnicola kamekurae]